MNHPHLPQLCGKESHNGAQQGGDSNSSHSDKGRRYDNCCQTVDGPVEPHAQCSRYEQTISCGGRETNMLRRGYTWKGLLLTQQTLGANCTDYCTREEVTHKSTERDDYVVCIHVH